MILRTKITFIIERSWKYIYFLSKMAWPTTTYDFISRYHRNWSLLNLPQNVREGWTNSYWKRQVLMFYPLGKNSEKPQKWVASEFVSLIVKAFRCFEDFFQPLPTVRLTTEARQLF